MVFSCCLGSVLNLDRLEFNDQLEVMVEYTENRRWFRCFRGLSVTRARRAPAHGAAAIHL